MSEQNFPQFPIIKRKWSNVIKPISKYDRQNNQLNFPLDFFYSLEKMIQLGYIIKLNIPHTLTGAHDNFLQTIFTSSKQQIGQIKLTPSYSKTKFEAQIEKMDKQNIKKVKNKQIIQDFLNQQQQAMSSKIFSFPYVVMKQKVFQQKIFISNVLIWNSYQYKKISNIDVTHISQAYIFTKNLTASITRFFYDKNTCKSVAYRIENQQSYAGKNRNKLLWKVKQNKQYSCNFLKIMYQNKSFYAQTLNLIQNMQKYFHKQVSKIVTDWVIDPNDKYYLIDVKQIQLIQSKPKFRITRSLTDLLSTVTCSMCLQTCNQSQISKILTNKLINSFCEHLKRRGVALSFRINTKKMNNISRVCDLCYSLVVEQTKLIEAENKMSLACNFNTQFADNYNTSSVPQLESPQMMPKLYQWRLFFYLENIINFFQIFEDAGSKYQDVTTIYLNLWIHESLTTFQIPGPFKNKQELKAIKIQHLFSQSFNINEFLQKAQIRIQILLKINSHKPYAQGCIHGIQSEQNQKISQSFLQRKYKQMLIFNQNSKYCVLGLYIGICNDGLVNTIGLNLQKYMNVYKLESENVNCLSLPPEWMQILDHNYCPSQKYQYNVVQNAQTNDNQENKIVLKQRISSTYSSFSPKITKRQRSFSQKKMFNPINFKKTSQKFKLTL